MLGRDRRRKCLRARRNVWVVKKLAGAAAAVDFFLKFTHLPLGETPTGMG